MSTRQIQADSRLWRFHGGLKLRHSKQASLQGDIVSGPQVSRYFVEARQSAGPPGRLIVKSGAQVLAGQPLTAADAPLSVPVHSPVSGRISGLFEGPIPRAPELRGLGFEIQSDGNNTWVDPVPLPDPLNQAPEVIRDHLHSAGLTGLGGALFPTHTKLDLGHTQKLQTLVLNGVECEPYISCDEILMRERAASVVEGAALAMHVMGIERCVIALEDTMTSIRDTLHYAIDASGMTGISIVQVPTIYPEGGERQLIQVLTGQEVPADGLPAHLGIMCLNVATAAAAAQIVATGFPITSRVTTVTGQGISNPLNVEARIGTPIADLVAIAGGYHADVARLIVGGPMMGIALPSDDFPVTKSTNCVLAMCTQEIQRAAPQMPCIRCGDCATVCPAQLLPQQLYWHIQSDNLSQAQSHGLDACIECGCCAQVCPSQIPLVDYYRFAKSETRFESLRAAAATKAQARWEKHESRIANAASSSRAAMSEQDSELQDASAAADQIAAAVRRARSKKHQDS